ncbi:MAG: hypothetical protein ABW321_04970 [Polyangiales bacterium]
MPIRFVTAIMAALLPAGIAGSTLEEIIPAAELPAAERGAFTDEGRFFVIGVPEPDNTPTQGLIAEVVRDDASGYALRPVFAGTLEGTVDGRIGSAPAGDRCLFSGMARRGNVLYAGCFAEDARVSLIEVDTVAGTVRAGYLTVCDDAPSEVACDLVTDIYPNGMSVDAEGRLYFTNMLAQLLRLAGGFQVEASGSGTVQQVVIDSERSTTTRLAFVRRAWYGSDILTDSPGPNGVQIEDDVLYYAAGPNINKVQINADGTAGEQRVHYWGAPLTYIDDFAVQAGELSLARLMLPGIVLLEPVDFRDTARAADTFDLDFDHAPSSVTIAPEGNTLFPPGSRIFTSYFGGGVHALITPTP